MQSSMTEAMAQTWTHLVRAKETAAKVQLKLQLVATTLAVACSPVSSRVCHPEVAAAPGVANAVARQGMLRFANRSEPTQISSHKAKSQ